MMDTASNLPPEVSYLEQLQHLPAKSTETGPGVRALSPDLDDHELEQANFSNRLAYPHSTCATCNAPLNLEEVQLGFAEPNIFCTQNREAAHLALKCNGYENACPSKFSSFGALKRHWRASHFHRSFDCAVQGCSVPLSYLGVYVHFKMYHPQLRYFCIQCHEGFGSLSALNIHAIQTMHSVLRCQYPECSREFSRHGDLQRHQLAHQSAVPRHPCPHCRKYRGNNGFKRKDHLRQHIRNYHNIEDPADAAGPSWFPSWFPSSFPCTFEGCDKIGVHSFETSKLMKTHLKKDHPSPFQCNQRGCDRVGNNGWMREKYMVKHVKKAHEIELTMN